MIPEKIRHWGGLETWTLPRHLRRQARERGDRPFLQKGDEPALTYAEVLERSLDFAARLSALGVRSGDRVITMMPTSVEAVLAWFGAALMGAVDVPLNTGYLGQTLVHGVNLAAGRVMVVDPAFLPRLAEVEPDLHRLETVVTTSGAASARFSRMRAVDLDAISPGPALDLPEPRFSDLASVVYTSGTTGPAKGVLIPHGQAYSYAMLSVDGFKMTPDDVFLCVHPLFHVGGKGAVSCSLLSGCRVVLTDGFDARTWVDDVRRFGATLTICHGPMLEMIFAQPERPDDADQKLRAFMAAPLPTAIAEDFERRFGARGVEVYGMTEVSTPVWRPLDEPLRVGTSGVTRSELFEVRVVDPVTDVEMPAGEVGEITVRGHLPFTLMQGYMSMPEESLRAWRNQIFHTGDVGYFDADGYLHFTDRARDRIRRRAENISSYEIEVAAGSHPGIIECAAVGIPSDFQADDDIKLFVVSAEAVDFALLTEHLVRRLPHYMVPRFIERIDALPRTPTKKVRKQDLRDRGQSEATWDRRAQGISVREIAERVRR